MKIIKVLNPEESSKVRGFAQIRCGGFTDHAYNILDQNDYERLSNSWYTGFDTIKNLKRVLTRIFGSCAFTNYIENSHLTIPWEVKYTVQNRLETPDIVSMIEPMKNVYAGMEFRVPINGLQNVLDDIRANAKLSEINKIFKISKKTTLADFISEKTLITVELDIKPSYTIPVYEYASKYIDMVVEHAQDMTLADMTIYFKNYSLM